MKTKQKKTRKQGVRGKSRNCGGYEDKVREIYVGKSKVTYDGNKNGIQSR